MTASVIVIADDLTGAADSAAAFARQGLRTMVLWKGTPLPDADVLVFTTESRHRTADEAIRCVREVVDRIAAMLDASIRIWVYKKIDSTLRGHPGPELAVVMAELGVKRALVAPAFPAQGRVTRDGLQYVHGSPLAESPFRREVPTSDIGARFAEGFSAGMMRRLLLSTVRQGASSVAARLVAVSDGLIIADAETDADLDCLAQGAQLGGVRLLCGSAGLAAALMRAMADQGQITPIHPGAEHRPGGKEGHVLTIAASRHPQTTRQVEVAEAAGVPVVRPDVTWLQGEPGMLVDQCALQLGLGPLIITSQGLPDLPGQGEAIVARLAQLVRDLLKRTCPAGLVLTGGDMAMATARALEAEALWLQDEIQPGVPRGLWVGGVAPGMPVVTKAGGFGDDNTLLAAIRDRG